MLPFSPWSRCAVLWAVLVPVFVVASSAGAQRVYWDDTASPFGASLHRAGTQGESMQTLGTTASTGLSTPRYLWLDETNGKLYWADTGADRIQRSNLDGSGVESILVAADGIGAPFGVAVDVLAAKVYWSELGSPTTTLRRANLDGSSVETLIGSSGVGAIALDPASGKVYWTDVLDATGVYRANLDGTGIEHIVSSATALLYQGIAIDTTGGKLYWADSGVERILRSNLDGSAMQSVIDTNVGSISGIALDSVNARIYWTDTIGQRLLNVALGGTVPETILDASSGLGAPFGIAVEPGGVAPPPPPPPSVPLDDDAILLLCAACLVLSACATLWRARYDTG